MAAMVDRELELRAHAIIGRDQQWISKARRLEVEKAAKAAQFGICTGTAGGLGQGSDGAHQRIAGGDVNASLGVAVRFGIGHGTRA